MDHLWIWLTVFASALQTVRTAGQKAAQAHLSLAAATYVRSFVGLPVLLAWLAFVTTIGGAHLPKPTFAFAAFATLAALTQMAGTLVLLRLYRQANFAAANQLAKSDIVFTSLLATFAFAQPMPSMGWLALAVTIAGVALIMAAQSPATTEGIMEKGLSSPAVRGGLAVGAIFGLCNVAVQQTSLALDGGSLIARAAVSVVAVNVLQVAMMAPWLARKEPGTYASLARQWRLAAFVGITSACGSIAWFAAFALTNPAYVRAVGQVEVVFSVLASAYWFRERIRPAEWAGIALTLLGGAMFRLV